MSSKKQRRRERRRNEEEAVRPGLSNATIFIIVIGLALVAIVGGAVLLNYDGASASGGVWSEEHGHYH